MAIFTFIFGSGHVVLGALSVIGNDRPHKTVTLINEAAVAAQTTAAPSAAIIPAGQSYLSAHITATISLFLPFFSPVPLPWTWGLDRAHRWCWHCARTLWRSQRCTSAASTCTPSGSTGCSGQCWPCTCQSSRIPPHTHMHTCTHATRSAISLCPASATPSSRRGPAWAASQKNPDFLVLTNVKVCHCYTEASAPKCCAVLCAKE